MGQEKGKQFCLRLHLPSDSQRKLPYIVLAFKNGPDLSKWSMAVQNIILKAVKPQEIDVNCSV